MAPRRYHQASPPSWAAEVESWPWVQLDRRSHRKAGDCPTCGHEITVDVRTVVLSFLPGLRGARARRKVLVVCNCAVEHPGHPPDPKDAPRRWGCGAHGHVAGP